MKVDIFIPCFIDQIYPEVAVDMVKVLRKAGCEVNYNVNQTCCGQPAYNAGMPHIAKEVSKKFLTNFDTDNNVVCPAGSCVGFVRSGMPPFFKGTTDEPTSVRVANKVFEFSEFLVNILGVTDFGADLNGVAVYHDACGALRECKIKKSPRVLLDNVANLTMLEAPDCEVCCGFGGTFSVTHEPISVAMAEQKIDNAIKLGADYLISTDMSCLMHLKAYTEKFNRKIKLMHLASVLATKL